jgi:hypothetical protein
MNTHPKTAENEDSRSLRKAYVYLYVHAALQYIKPTTVSPLH